MTYIHCMTTPIKMYTLILHLSIPITHLSCCSSGSSKLMSPHHLPKHTQVYLFDSGMQAVWRQSSHSHRWVWFPTLINIYLSFYCGTQNSQLFSFPLRVVFLFNFVLFFCRQYDLRPLLRAFWYLQKQFALYSHSSVTSLKLSPTVLGEMWPTALSRPYLCGLCNVRVSRNRAEMSKSWGGKVGGCKQVSKRKLLFSCRILFIGAGKVEQLAECRGFAFLCSHLKILLVRF